MSWKEVLGVLVALIVVIAFAMEAYKKDLRQDKAERREIVLIAILLTLIVTGSFSFGLGFPGLPWAYVGYATGVFFLQWFINQKVIKQICKALGLFGKAQLKKAGIKLEDEDE